MNKETFRNFAAGVVTGMQPDEIPPEASPRSWNTALINVGGQQAIPAKRRGASIINTAAISGTPSVHGQANFYRRSGANLTQYHLLFGDDGSLNRLNSGTIAAADAGSPTPFTAGDLIPSCAAADNLLFMVNGTDAKKFDGTDVTGLGITRPSAPTVVDAGVAGNPDGTYEFALSYGNSSTGHESSRSDSTSVTITTNKITVSWATPADAQVDQVFLYVRKPAVTTEFFRLIVGVSPAVDASDAFGITADPITVDVTDTQLNALLTLAPDTAENDPPVAGIKAVAFHQSRLFAFDETSMYYSKVGLPESFDPEAVEPINNDDSQRVVGGFSAFGTLVIWKGNSTYVLNGTDPDTWQVELADPFIGNSSLASAVFINGYLYWWSTRGPVRWNGSGTIEPIGETYLSPTVSADALDYSLLDHVVAGVDMTRQKVLFAVPERGTSRNSLILPFNYRTGGWDSDKWDPFDVASMCVVEDSSGSPWVMMGNYNGRVFQWWNADLDGARVLDDLGVALTLSGTPTGSTSTTVTDSTANFDTDDNGLADLYAYFEDAEGVRVRRRIVSNTATVLTLVSDIYITPTSYVIATPDWQHDTKWSDMGDPFARKHLLFLQAQATSQTGGGTLTIEVFTNFDLTEVARSITFDVEGSGAVWDTAVWDTSAWGSEASYYNTRSRVAKVARLYRIRVRNQEPNVQVALTKLTMTFQPQGVRA